MIVDCAVYTDGARRAEPLRIEDALEATRDPSSFVWIGLHEPDPAEFDLVAAELGLHELAVEDAVRAHQRPKLEVYDDDLFVVLKAARYVDHAETVELAEIQVFVGESYVVSVRHGEGSGLAHVRAAIEEDSSMMRCGPMTVLHAIIDSVVDEYAPVIEGLDNDMAEIEEEVFSADRDRGDDPSRRIFQLKREVLDLYRNMEPLLEPLGRLARADVPRAQPDLDSYFRNVEDHLTRAIAALASMRDLLTDALNANLAQVSVRQNDDMRTISAWVAIGGIPTVVGAIYGMNFEHMPELDSRVGYPLVLLLTALACLWLHRRLKRIGWL